MKKFIIGCLSILSVVSFSAEAQMTDSLRVNASVNIQKLQQVMTALNTLYLDTVNNDRLVNKAIQDMLVSLDPHSNFIAKEDVQQTNEALEGKFDGIGVEFAIINDTLTIQRVIQGGPSMKVGLQTGDKIVAVDGENVAGVHITTDDVRSKLRGPKGSKVNVDVLRTGVNERLSFVITRDQIPLNSVEAAYGTEDDIFYIRLGEFAQNSCREIVDALMNYDKYPKGIILDLRQNGGGYLISALQIAGLFLEKDKLVLYSEGLHEARRDYNNPTKGVYLTGPVVVMIDENSASASEIVSGALQDWDRAIVVGRRSFGKGLVQRQVNLADGSQLRLTISRYHTPSGRVIQSPYENGKRNEYYSNSNGRYASGELFHRDSIKTDTSQHFYTLNRNRDVYGGGGIIPDIFVPLDTTYSTRYFSELVRKGTLQEYVNLYVDGHRSELTAVSSSYDKFCSHYAKIEESLVDGLIEYASKSGINRNDSQIEISMSAIKRRMKGLIASSLMGTTGFYRVINEEDADFAAAVEAIKNWDKFWK